MLTIRFARVGKNKRAQFQIVLQEHTVAPGGRHIEVLGSYDPHLKKATLKEEKIKEFISKGAKLSDTVHNLFVSKGIISKAKRKVKLPARIAEQSDADGSAKKVDETAAAAEEVKTPETKEEAPKEEIKEEVKNEEVKEEVKAEAK